MLQLLGAISSVVNSMKSWLETNYQLGEWAEAFASVIVIYLTLRKKRTFGFGSLTIDKWDGYGHLKINNLYNTNNSARLIKIIQVPSKRYNKYIVFNKKCLGINSLPYNVDKQKDLTFNASFLNNFLCHQSELEKESYDDYKYTDIYVRDGYHTVYKLRSNYNLDDNSNPQWTYKKLTSHSIFLLYFPIQLFNGLKVMLHNKILFKLCWNRYCIKQSLDALNDFINKFKDLIKYYKDYKKDKEWNNEPSYSSWNNLFHIKFDSKVKSVELAFGQLKKSFDSISNNRLRELMLKKINDEYKRAKLPQCTFKENGNLTFRKINIRSVFNRYTSSFRFKNYVNIFIKLAEPLLDNIKKNLRSCPEITSIKTGDCFKNLKGNKDYILHYLDFDDDISFKAKHKIYVKVKKLCIVYSFLDSAKITKNIKEDLNYITKYIKNHAKFES